MSCAMGEPPVSSRECGAGSEAVTKKQQEQSVFPFEEVVLCCGGRKLSRSQFIVSHKPQGCSTTAHGHPCSATCPQPAQEEDLCRKITADVWVGCGEAQRRDQEGSRSSHTSHRTTLCYSVKSNLPSLRVSILST